MSGRDLYAYYTRANEAQGIFLDDWDQLHETDREIWNATAAAAREACS